MLHMKKKQTDGQYQKVEDSSNAVKNHTNWKWCNTTNYTLTQSKTYYN